MVPRNTGAPIDTVTPPLVAAAGKNWLCWISSLTASSNQSPAASRTGNSIGRIAFTPKLYEVSDAIVPSCSPVSFTYPSMCVERP